MYRCDNCDGEKVRGRKHRCSLPRIAELYVKVVLNGVKNPAFNTGTWAQHRKRFPRSRKELADVLRVAFLAGATERDYLEKVGLFKPTKCFYVDFNNTIA